MCSQCSARLVSSWQEDDEEEDDDDDDMYDDMYDDATFVVMKVPQATSHPNSAMKVGDIDDEVESLPGSPRFKSKGLKLFTDKRGGHNSKNGPAEYESVKTYILPDNEQFASTWLESPGEILSKIQEYSVRMIGIDRDCNSHGCDY